jgi:multidrug efflux pump subunit AcrB
LRAPIVLAGLALLFAAVAAAMFGSLDEELLPAEDRGAIQITLSGPEGVALSYTDRQVAQVEALLQPYVESGEIEGVFAIVGRWDLNRALILGTLAPWDRRSRSQQEIADELRGPLEAVPGARINIANPNSLGLRDAGLDLEFAITGTSYERLADVGTALEAALRDVPELSDPRLDFATTQPELSLRIDRERVADLGIDMQAVSMAVRSMVDGYDVTDLNVDDRAVPIMLHASTGTLDDPEDLRSLFVAGNDGRLVPLSAIATLEEAGISPELDREEQRRAITIDAGLGTGYSLREAMEAVAIVVVLLVLAAQFESFASALVVMVTVPFGIAAAIVALWLTGMSLNIYSQIGLVMLVGLMAKNGILIVEFANQLRDEGQSVAEAARNAATIRLRPVMMTMISTVLGGLPLVIGSGPGAEARAAIGWVAFGGLGLATLFTLFLTPVAYVALARLSKPRGDTDRRLAEELRAAEAVQ